MPMIYNDANMTSMILNGANKLTLHALNQVVESQIYIRIFYHFSCDSIMQKLIVA